MRAATRSTPKVSRATRAARMLELSPLETAAKASASRIPASSSTARSNPMPVTVLPSKSLPRRRNDVASMSMTATSWPLVASVRARVAPTRPQPMMTKCTVLTLHACGTPCDHANTRIKAYDAGRGRFRQGRQTAHRRTRNAQRPTGGNPSTQKLALPIFASDALSSVAYAPMKSSSCSALPVAPSR